LGGKRKPKFVKPTQFHPYRKDQKTGLIITPDNIGVLKEIGDALVSSK